MTEFRLTILDPTLARVFDVPVGITLIGRESSTDLPVLDQQVSRRHAQFISDGQICELVDLGSANGTFVDDERLTPQAPVTLADGARIRFGPVETRFEIIASAEPADAPIGAVPEPPLHDAAAAEPAGPDADEPAGLVDEPPSPDLVLDLPLTSLPPVDDTPLSDSADGLVGAVRELPPLDAPPPVRLVREPSDHDGSDGAQPPSDHPALAAADLPEPPTDLPGLSIYSRHLINFLPGIYHSDFMARFLGIFESIQTPIEWTVDAFDLFLDPDSSPSSFLAWLGSWYGLTFDASWSEDQRRLLIGEAHAIFARRGTRWAMARILEIYSGSTPEIIDTGDSLEPFTFQVRLALPETTANRTLITRLIDAHKPAYTTYRLELLK